MTTDPIYVCDPDDDGIAALRQLVDAEADRILAVMAAWIVGAVDHCPLCAEPWHRHTPGYDPADVDDSRFTRSDEVLPHVRMFCPR